MQIGDVVLLTDENAPRSHWPLARVTEATPSKDGFVRKIKLQISTRKLDGKGKRSHDLTILERPIQRVILLYPANENENTQ